MHSGIANNKPNQDSKQLTETITEDYMPMDSCSKGSSVGATTAALAKERDLAALQRTEGRKLEAPVSTGRS